MKITTQFESATQVLPMAGHTLFIWSSRQLNLSAEQLDGVPSSIDLRPLGAYTAAFVSHDGSSATLLRSVTSVVTLYYTTIGEETLLNDFLEPLVNKLPAADRHPTVDSLADYLILGGPVGKNTYHENIYRLDTGQEVTINSHGLKENYFSTFTNDILHRRYVNSSLQELLQTACGDTTKSIVLYSGGVDSTILAALLPDAKLQSHYLDTPEYLNEKKRAVYGSSILQRPLDTVEVSKDEYFSALSALSRRLWCPSIYPQTALHFAALSRRGGRYVCGNLADTVFDAQKAQRNATGLVRRRVFLRDLKALKLRTLWRTLKASPRWNVLRDSKNFLAGKGYPLPEHDRSFLSAHMNNDDIYHLINILGVEKISQRISLFRKRISLVTGNIDKDTPRPVEDLIDNIFSTMDSTILWSEMARLQRSWIDFPFSDPDVIAFAARSLSNQADIMSKKEDLKNLLAELVPDYNTDLGKLGGHVVPFRIFNDTRYEKIFSRDLVFPGVASIRLHPRRTPYKMFWKLLHIFQFIDSIQRNDTQRGGRIAAGVTPARPDQ